MWIINVHKINIIMTFSRYSHTVMHVPVWLFFWGGGRGVQCAERDCEYIS